MKPGNYKLESQESRGAARPSLGARKRIEPKERQGNMEGLAEALRAARMRHSGEGLTPTVQALDGGQ